MTAAERLLSTAQAQADADAQRFLDAALAQATAEAQQRRDTVEAEIAAMTERAQRQLDDAVTWLVAWISGEEI